MSSTRLTKYLLLEWEDKLLSLSRRSLKDEGGLVMSVWGDDLEGHPPP